MKRFRHIGATTLIACTVYACSAASLAAQTAPQQPAAEAAKPAKPKAKSAKAAAAPADAAAPKADPTASQKLIDAGIASYQGGKYDVAEQQITAALSGGKLPSAQMARALYFRGAAYRKLSKPALAISDLTSALWLKGGLNDADRADAMAQRAAAYREAGLPDQADGAAASTAKAPAAGAASDRSTAAARPSTPLQTATITPTATPEAIARQPVLAAVPQQPSASAAAGEGSASGIGGFLSNLFASPPPAAQVAGSAQPAPAATSGWSQSTEVRKQVAPAARVASAAPAAAAQAAPAAAAPSKASGRYHLQVAAVRSRDEAQSVAQRVRQQYPAEMASRTAEIDEAVVGNMGTLYRVKIGPFADPNEPRALCAKLRGAGLDCMLVNP